MLLKMDSKTPGHGPLRGMYMWFFYFIQLLPDFFALLSVLWAVLMLFPMAWFKVLALDAQGKCQNNLK